MFRLYSEWDIGESNLVFASKEAGMRWLNENSGVAEIAAEDNQSIKDCIQECFDWGYFEWDPVQLVE